MQQRLAKDENVRSESRTQVHGHDLRRARVRVRGGARRRSSGVSGAGSLAANILAHTTAQDHALLDGQWPHVVLRAQAQREPLEHDLQVWSVGGPAVLSLRGVGDQRAGELAQAVTGHAKVGGAGVDDASAAAILANVQGPVADAHRLDLHLPIAHLLGRHRRPLQRRQHALAVVAPQRYLTAEVLAAVGARQEDAKLQRRRGAASTAARPRRAGDAVEEAELG
mmetsp:Transcript_89552/g.256501  ORF Transcript_89552/g.256501 Transcript_89552/m.256501 type:complete len:224 (-) Transcript_89552:806-1477(-)